MQPLSIVAAMRSMNMVEPERLHNSFHLTLSLCSSHVMCVCVCAVLIFISRARHIPAAQNPFEILKLALFRFNFLLLLLFSLCDAVRCRERAY